VTQSNAVKLGITSGAKVRVQGTAPADAVRVLDVPPTVIERQASALVSVLFADDVADVTKGARKALSATLPGGRTWVAYRKGASRRSADAPTAALHRDTLQATLLTLGLGGVTLVSLDDEWSAMRIKEV
jgi:hypothetical protein